MRLGTQTASLFNHIMANGTIEDIVPGETGANNGFYGKTHSEETKEKISNNQTYKSEEFRNKCRDRMLGTKLSDETKKKQSEALKGIPKPKIECPHCGKIGGVPQMKRHHFDNCKTKG